MVFVHAHPDDETINNGATMALYAAQGAHVTLVTCTRGEEGEVIPADLAHLASGRDDTLGDHRVGELADAMAALGVHDHRFLGEEQLGAAGPPVRFRDSGMAWGPDGRAVPAPTTRDDAFARVPVDDAAARLAAVLREVRPHVVVTYEPGGGYGHPDHVHAHRVTMRAVDLAAQPGPGGDPWPVPKVYWVVAPEEPARVALAALAEKGANPFEGWTPDGPLPSMFVPEALVTAGIDGSAYLEAKTEAMRAHATQINVEGPFFALSNGVGQPLLAWEFYQQVRGTPGPDRGDDGRESDLFSGVA